MLAVNVSSCFQDLLDKEMVCLSYSICSCFFEEPCCLCLLDSGFQFSQRTNLEDVKVAITTA